MIFVLALILPFILSVHCGLLSMFEPITNNIPVPPIPVFGPHCGPSEIKPIAWLIPDKLIFLGKSVSFTDACKAHDKCWYESKFAENRRHQAFHCDDVFLGDMRHQCDKRLTGIAEKTCKTIAKTYYWIVHRVAKRIFS
jgi:hypothetical protein